MPYLVSQGEYDLLSKQRDQIVMAISDGGLFIRPDLTNALELIIRIMSDSTIINCGPVEFVKDEAPVIEDPTPLKTSEETETTNANSNIETEAATEVEEEPVKEEPVEEKPKYSGSEVRKYLGQRRREGIDVPGILETMGYYNFTEVPASRYNELVEAMKNA